jgi:hypothetical protein
MSLLLGSMGSAWALSLGSPAADAWIGRPLKMTVPASFASAAPDDECVQADVFYGDTRLPPSAVRATVIGPEGQRQVRVEAQTIIDEPVVTVSLRAGCRNSVTRNYTLLPELPTEAMIAAWNRAAPTLAANATGAPLRLATSTAPAPQLRTHRATRVAAAATSDAATPRVRTHARHPAHAAHAGPRLELEPIAIEPQPTSLLRASTELANPAGDPARRATAALLWQAINADPQQVLRTSAMLQQLERDMAQLQQSAKQTRAEMLALRQRVDRAQPWYVSRGIVQVLAVLVLAMGAAVGWLWLRARRSGALAPAWYQPPLEPRRTEADVDLAALESEAPPPIESPQRIEPVITPVPAMPDVPVAAAPKVAAPEGTIDFEVPAFQPAAPAKQEPSGVLRVETLAATFEEVEFLASLGLASDATDVLKAYLEDSARPSPIAFYELMRVCDEDGDSGAVAAVRRRYRQVFGVEAPQLEQVKAPQGVEGFAALSARLTHAWGQREAAEIIERALFEAPAPAAALTLQAGRELIVLYELALALLTDVTPGSEAQPLAPWAHAEDAAEAHAVAQHHAEAEGGQRFALDIDLSAAPEPLPEKPEEPAVEVGPLLAELQAASARAAAERRRQEEEEAFSAAVASERMPVSRL